MAWRPSSLALVALIAFAPFNPAVGGEGDSPGADMDPVTVLKRIYGPPSQAGFGSAVFNNSDIGDTPLAEAAFGRYRYFVGELWSRYGEAAWTEPWREVYRRPPGSVPDIVAELRSLPDPAAASSASMVVDLSVEARTALNAVFDDPAVMELAVFNLGDGGAMSGILLAAKRAPPTGDAVFLAFLLD